MAFNSCMFLAYCGIIKEKKKRVVSHMKKIITGVIIGCAVSLPLGVFAGSGIHDVKLANDTKLVVNGKQIKTDVVFGVLDTATNGKNYVSARDLSEALGYDVAWDGANKEIKIGKGDSVESTTVAEPTTATNKYTPPEDIINNADYIIIVDGVYYCTANYLADMAYQKGYKYKYYDDTKQLKITLPNKDDLSIQLYDLKYGLIGITYDYYVDNIEPLLK